MSEISSETRFLHAIEMGLGAWQWGDRVVWQYGHGYGESQVHEAFLASLNEGIRFIDTAELYGNGLSERLLGRFIKETDQPVLIATKLVPWPWRFYKGAVTRALQGSLSRLNVDSVDLYQVHFPLPFLSGRCHGRARRMCKKWTYPHSRSFQFWTIEDAGGIFIARAS